MRVLLAASECVPLVKTGGLADVIGALPAALAEVGVEARVLLPGYPAVMAALQGVEDLGPPPGADATLAPGARLLSAQAAGLDLLVLDAPSRFDRQGGLYENRGIDWPDNPERFAVFAQTAAGIARDGAGKWRPDVLHVHDWQTALAPVYLAAWGVDTPSALTIHNIAYQGRFDATLAPMLGLPPAGYGQGWEFHGHLGFLKGGLMAASAITTVSPGYAREILTPAFGLGLEGVLQARRGALHGILNGADTAIWDPATDTALPQPYNAQDMAGKAEAKKALQSALGLAPAEGPLLGVVSRLTGQKGIDLLLAALPGHLARGGQLALLGTGDADLENALKAAAQANPSRVGVRIGYDEGLAHLFFGGSDAIAVPSRFEPCGLTQLYALRYGNLPVVARTGGLGDTVIDANPAALAVGAATGIVHEPGSATALDHALQRLSELWAEPAAWRAVQVAGMEHPIGWGSSAWQYRRVYEGLLRP
ncbi:MAG: glycogen synthase GlgA [Pseudomonadota bacterium]